MLTALFNCVAGLTLFLFAVHYVYYILNALATTAANHRQSDDEQPPSPQHAPMQQTGDAKFIKKLVYCWASIYREWTIECVGC